MKVINKTMSMVLGVTVAFMGMTQPFMIQGVQAAGEQTVTMDKQTYLYGQPISLSYTGASLKDWIGLYNAGAIPQGSNPSLTWQYTSAAGQPNGTMNFTKSLPAGKYEALYMQNDGYNIFQRAPFSIITLNPPAGITFVDTDDDTDQIAGDVKIKIPADPANVTHYNLYWGNDVGKLPGEPIIAQVEPPTTPGETYATYTIPANTVIPKGATKLLAYSDSTAGETTASAEITIPGMVKEKPLVSFEVITDMHVQTSKDHVHNKNLEDAFKDMIALNPDSDGLMTIGDNTENGTEAQYMELARIFNMYKDQLPETYFVQGNHDVRWGDWTQFSELFHKYTNMKSSYYNVWINGYQFIFLGTEKGLKDFSYLSETQLKWLDEKLADSQGKPTFIFHHQPLKNTVAGANDGYLKSNYWYGVRQDTELKTILAKHPGAFLFSGHTHWELGAKDTMYNAKYATMFNAGATSYLWTDANTGKDGSQGFFVEVYGDKVRVKGRDFKNDTWIANAQYEIDLFEKIPVVDPSSDPDLTLSNPTVQMAKEKYLSSEAIEVGYTNSVREDWIGIFPTGTKLGKNIKAIAQQKTSGVKQPNGTVSFKDLKLAPGKYDAIYVGEAEYRSDNDNIELGRVTFTIVDETQAQGPQAVSFTDADKNKGVIGGDVTITPAANEANIDEYVLYWGNEEGKLSGQSAIASVAKTGEKVIYVIPNGTAIPNGATKILAFSKQKDTESADFAQTALKDAFTEVPPVTPPVDPPVLTPDEQLRQANRAAAEVMKNATDEDVVEEQAENAIKQLSKLIKDDQLSDSTHLALVSDSTDTVLAAMVSKWKEDIVDEDQVLEQTYSLLKDAFLPVVDEIEKNDQEQWEQAVKVMAHVAETTLAKLDKDDLSEKWVKKLKEPITELLAQVSTIEADDTENTEEIVAQIERFAQAVEDIETALDKQASLFGLEKTIEIRMDRARHEVRAAKKSEEEEKSSMTLSGDLVDALGQKQINVALVNKEDAGVWLSTELLKENDGADIRVELSKPENIKKPSKSGNASDMYEVRLEADNKEFKRFDSETVRMILPYEHKEKYLMPQYYDESKRVWNVLKTSKGKTVDVIKTGDRASFEIEKPGIYMVANTGLQRVNVTPSRASLLPGESLQLEVTGWFSNRTEQDLTDGESGTVYESDNSGVTVDENGLIEVSEDARTGKKVTIKVSNGEKSTKVTFTIAEVKSISLSAKKSTVKPGSTVQMSVSATMTDRSKRDMTKESTGTTYTVVEAEYAEISEDGLVTVHEDTPDKTEVTIVAENDGHTSEYTLKVRK
ncbi:metallophosphoesterase [Brevibacillus sp. M2.1A]|uniref:metallophosphoesterase n=1 Tax=Brevibacillus sp. M2.1A TaxID=2738980 RepID=UPI00156B326C|nr:metallophosphoesterase [Brevibacillus sp. M2.1A]MCC8433352.1 metallophosphoesterase [Brevibacillus sp. M2.1A]